jgi:hypothetical protein
MAMRCDNAPEFTRLNSGPQGAPNLLKYLNVSVEPWGRCLAIAELVYNGDASDVTFGATRYFEISLDPDEVIRNAEALSQGSCITNWQIARGSKPSARSAW